MRLFVTYLPHPKGDGEIQFSVAFNRDSHNWGTGQAKKIGYEVCVTPVKRTKQESGLMLIEFGAFTGFNDNLLEVGRQSSKRLTAAVAELHRRIPTYMEAFA